MQNEMIIVFSLVCLLLVSVLGFGPLNQFRKPAKVSYLHASAEGGLKRVGTAVVAGCIAAASVLPPSANAVPLGAHTTCAYPACTTQEEILKANAPGLMSAEEKTGLAQDLKDMQFILDNAFLKMLEQEDYSSMRAGLRQSPMMNLRLTVRKYKDVLDEPAKKEFMTKYSKMIDNLDTFDVFVFKRTQGASSDKEVEKFLRAAIVDFDQMIEAAKL